MVHHPHPLGKSDKFAKRNPHESICMACYATVRAQTGENLAEAEKRHGAECVERKQ